MKIDFKNFEDVANLLVSEVFANLANNTHDNAEKSSVGSGKSIELAIPGYGKEDVKIEVKEKVLYIYLKDELFRRLPIGAKIDPSSIKATVKHGLLTLSFEKKEEKPITLNID